MGLRNGNYPPMATFWKITKMAENGKTCDVQISISKKNKQTDQYEQDFSGFVRFCGENMVKFAQSLKEKDRIDIDSFDVTNHYDRGKNVTYWNVSVFAAKKHEWEGNNTTTNTANKLVNGQPASTETSIGSVDDDDDDLPFV